MQEKLPPEVEFVQAITIDINGLARGKTFPIKKLPALLRGKEEAVGMLEVCGSRSEIPFSIKELSDNGYKNIFIVPDISSIRVAPWCKDKSLAMFFYDSYDITTNTPWPFCPRYLAKQKLKELEEHGYKLLCGVENEFRLFTKTTMEPIFKYIHLEEHFMATTTVLPFIRQLKSRLDCLDIDIDSWNLEYGEGQIEIPLMAYMGLDGLDKVWQFRELTKYVAHDMDMIASYMTTPLANDSANGMHLNHSLLSSSNLENVMSSKESSGKLSEIAQHWLAGLAKHTRALTAFTSPTVNCYRRIKSGGFAPTVVSWNYETRDVAYRVKTNAAMGNQIYIENRTPSSGCNIYLAVSGMIVAGLDGIRNKLSLPAPRNEGQCESVPTSLQEALEALGNDDVMREGLGVKFVDWYIKIKMECDVNVLKGVNLSSNTQETLQDEITKYFML